MSPFNDKSIKAHGVYDTQITDKTNKASFLLTYVRPCIIVSKYLHADKNVFHMYDSRHSFECNVKS